MFGNPIVICSSNLYNIFWYSEKISLIHGCKHGWPNTLKPCVSLHELFYLYILEIILFALKLPLVQHESCELAKHYHVVFSSKSYKKSKLFTMMHKDVRGPSSIKFFWKHWFVTFINDHTRVTWVFHIIEKIDAETVLENFYNMVQKQFKTQIKVFQSGNV